MKPSNSYLLLLALAMAPTPSSLAASFDWQGTAPDWNIASHWNPPAASLTGPDTSTPVQIMVNVKPGFNLLANPLNGTNNLISTVIPNAPDGSQVLLWDPAIQSYNDGATYFAPDGWFDNDSFQPSTLVLEPGKGVFIQNPAPTDITLTFNGTEAAPSLPAPIVRGGYVLLSRRDLGSGTWENIVGLPPEEGCGFLTFNPITQSYTTNEFSGGSWSLGAPALPNANSAFVCFPPPTPPVITQQPQSQTVAAGSDAQFSVVVTGAGPLTYQWLHAGTPIAGAAGPTLGITAVQLGDGGDYSVVVSNGFGVAVSDDACLTVGQGDNIYVFNADLFLGSITNNEPAGTAGGRDTLDFSPTTTLPVVVDLSKTTPQIINSNLTLTLAFLNAIENATGSAQDDILIGNALENVLRGGLENDLLIGADGNDTLIGGAGDDTCVFTGHWGVDTVVEDPGGGYDALDFSAVPSLLTVDITDHLTVFSGTNWVTHPGREIEQVLGGMADDSFTVTAATNATLTMDGGGGSNVLTFDAENLFVILEPGNITTQGRQPVLYSGFNLILLINTTLGTPPIITLPPQSQTVVAGSNVTFTVAASGTPPLSYQWRFNGVDLPGETNTSLTRAPVQLEDQGRYDVSVSNASGLTASPAAILTAIPGPVGGVVLINEVLTHADASGTNFIELQAPGAAVDIGGWYLTDNFGEPKRFRLEPGTTVPAGGYLAVPESLFQATPGATNGFVLKPNGGEVWLFSADQAGYLSGYFHGFSYGAAERGVSFGRYLTSQREEHFAAQSGVSAGASNAGPRAGPLVVSEIMFHPPDDGTNSSTLCEFIELQNLSSEAVALFDQNVPPNPWNLLGTVAFDFAANTFIDGSGQLLVVSFDPQADLEALAAFRARYAVSPTVPIVGPYMGALDDRDGTIQLFMPGQPPLAPVTNLDFLRPILVEQVHYSADQRWPGGADGTGASLQRRVPAEYGNDPINWAAASPTAGAAYPGPTAPSIVVQPQNQTVMADSTAAFSVSVAGTPPFTYQWRRNGDNIIGAIANTHEIHVAQATDAGSYDVLVSNAAGLVTSASAVLMVSPPTTRSPFGLPHAGLGGASLLLDGTNLLVSNLSPGGGAGVSIELPVADGVSVSLTAIALGLPGQSIAFGAAGSLGGVPGSLLGTIAITNSDNTVQIFVNYLPFGASNVLVEVWEATRLVGTVMEPALGVVGTLGPGPAGLPQIVRAQALPSLPGSFPGFVIDLDGLGQFTPPGGQPLLGNQIKILALNAPNSVDHLSAFTVTGANLNSFQIVGETVGPPAPVLGAHRDGGAMVISWSGAAYLLAASEVAASAAHVSGAASPYTIPIGLEDNRFFWLSRQGPDGDGDDLPDDWELQHGLNPFDPSDAAHDLDGDGASNLSEYRRQTDPGNATSAPVTFYVDGIFGDDTLDGLTPYLQNGHGPKKRIQSAIAGTTPNDGLSIAPGFYQESLVFTNNLGPITAPKAVIGPSQ